MADVVVDVGRLSALHRDGGQRLHCVCCAGGLLCRPVVLVTRVSPVQNGPGL